VDLVTSLASERCPFHETSNQRSWRDEATKKNPCNLLSIFTHLDYCTLHSETRSRRDTVRLA